MAVVKKSRGEQENHLVRNPGMTEGAALQATVGAITVQTVLPTGEVDLTIHADHITATATDHNAIKAGYRVMATGHKEMVTGHPGMETELRLMVTETPGMETGLQVTVTEIQEVETEPSPETTTGNTGINLNSGATGRKHPIKNSVNLKNLQKKIFR